MSEHEVYLGDGLYASFDGWQVRLRAPRENGDHEVFLDAATLQAVHAVSRRAAEDEGRSRRRGVKKDSAISMGPRFAGAFCFGERGLFQPTTHRRVEGSKIHGELAKCPILCSRSTMRKKR
jgi:hypothetical protein